jgi:hypothetical protein
MEFLARGGNGLLGLARKSCDLPPRERGAIAYAEGKPVDYDNDLRYLQNIVLSINHC